MAGAAAGWSRALADEAATVDLPFESGTRRLVTFPGKRPLLLLTHRPPQLETPLRTFLLAAFQRDLADLRRRASRARRGGNVRFVSLDTAAAEESLAAEILCG